jgi:hypothetical protein
MTGNKFQELSGFLSGAAEVSQFFQHASTIDDQTTMLSRSVEHIISKQRGTTSQNNG